MFNAFCTLYNNYLHPITCFFSIIFQECCAAKFSWNTNCEDDSPDNAPQAASDATLDVLYYPSTTNVQCLSDGMQPVWITVGEMFSTEEACCEYHFPSQDCVGNINDMKSLLYYPSSTQSICLSDGNQPDWVKLEDMFDTEEVRTAVCVCAE